MNGGTRLQLCLPLVPRPREPAIADAGDVVHQCRPDSSKLPATDHQGTYFRVAFVRICGG